MEIYKELYIRGSEAQLNQFISTISDLVNGDWVIEENNHNNWSNYLIFVYHGSKVEQAKIFFYIKNVAIDNNIHVGNIVPISQNKRKLTIEEYNNILDLFYQEIISLYKEDNIKIELSTDKFDPTAVMSNESINKLTLFSNAANKSTGSIHPCDRERWFDFIFTSFSNGDKLNEEIFARFLSDKEYWGEPDTCIIDESAWTDEKAKELAIEYSSAIEVLEKYICWKDNQ